MSKISKYIHENSFSLPPVHPGLQLFNEMGGGDWKMFLSQEYLSEEKLFTFGAENTHFSWEQHPSPSIQTS